MVDANRRGCSHKPKTKSPLIACLGRARVGNQRAYRFSLLTLLFSGVDKHFNSAKPCVFRVLQNFTLKRERQKFAAAGQSLIAGGRVDISA
jgi:hypothetical protein